MDLESSRKGFFLVSDCVAKNDKCWEICITYLGSLCLNAIEIAQCKIAVETNEENG